MKTILEFLRHLGVLLFYALLGFGIFLMWPLTLGMRYFSEWRVARARWGEAQQYAEAAAAREQGLTERVRIWVDGLIEVASIDADVQIYLIDKSYSALLHRLLDYAVFFAFVVFLLCLCWLRTRSRANHY